MMGYLDDPGLTATKIRSPGSNVYTGDRGRLDADGYLYVLGRMDQMVKVREQRVYPQEIADVLQEHPGVEECVALGAPVAAGDDNEIRAAVRLAAGATVSEQDLRQFAARRLPNHLVPARIVVLPEFPRTASRKVDLQQLRERLE
jgi:acyl-CoA synthetase (AMP-forming)/AMP-acid ligase II